MQPANSDESIQKSATEQWLTVYLILEVFSVALWGEGVGTVAREQKSSYHRDNLGEIMTSTVYVNLPHITEFQHSWDTVAFKEMKDFLLSIL